MSGAPSFVSFRRLILDRLPGSRRLAGARATTVRALGGREFSPHACPRILIDGAGKSDAPDLAGTMRRNFIGTRLGPLRRRTKL